MEAHQFTGVWGKWQDQYKSEDSQSRGTFLTANIAQTKAKWLERAIQRKEKRTTMDEKRIWIDAEERSNSLSLLDLKEIKTYRVPPQDVKDGICLIARLCGVSPETKLDWDKPPAELAVVVRRKELLQCLLPTYEACRIWMTRLLCRPGGLMEEFMLFSAMRNVDDACVEDVRSICFIEDARKFQPPFQSNVGWGLFTHLYPALEVCQILGTKRVREIIAEQQLESAERIADFSKKDSSEECGEGSVDMDESELTDHGWMDHKQDRGARPGYITAITDQDGGHNHFLQRGSLLDHLISSAGCDIARTEERGVTIWQLRAHYNEIENRCERDGWRSSWNNEPLVAESVNLYDTMALLVKPVTEQRLCSFVELVATAAQPPRWFCSHWW